MAIRKKQTKYWYGYVVQGNYGYGWDDLTYENTLKEAKTTAKEYRENERMARHRVIQRRILRSEM